MRSVRADNELLHFRKLPCVLLRQITSYFTSEVTVRIVMADNELLHFRSYRA